MADTCWQCSAPTGGLLFCTGCQALQPPPGNYFAFFSLPEKLIIGAEDLQKRFYTLSRQLHPDRFTRKPVREQQYSLEASSMLNDGFRTLRDPVLRAEYVLSRHGLEIAEQRTQNVPPELLEEVFELNMALEELRSGDAAAKPAIEQAKRDFESMLEATGNALTSLFAEWDQSGDRAALEKIRGVLNRRKYIQNLVRDVTQALEPA